MKLLGRGPAPSGGFLEGGETIAQVSLMLGMHTTYTSVTHQRMDWQHALLPAEQSSFFTQEAVQSFEPYSFNMAV